VPDNIPSPAQQVKDAQELHDVFEAFLAANQLPPIANQIASGLAAAQQLGLPTATGRVVAVLLQLLAPVAVGVLEAVAGAKADTKGAMNGVVAAAMTEFLGINISPDDIPTGQGIEENRARAYAIGDKLHDLLTKEFGDLAPITPERGAANARTFSGFAINFAVTNSLIGLLGELLSLGQIDQFRELGVEVAQSLGLGRLQRLALQPLIRNMIQQPYDLYLRKQLRPDRLTDVQYVHGVNAGVFQLSEVRDRLAEKGFPEPEIDRLMIDLSPHLTEGELERLMRYGDITLDQAVAELVIQGIPEVDARRRMRNQELARADAFITQYVNVLEKQVFHGALTLDAFNKLLDETPWTDTEKFWERNYVAVTLESPTHLLTFAQVKNGILEGILDFGYFDSWATSQGYADQEALVLEYEILVALDANTTKEQAKAAAAARKVAKPA
jgi:hypothetical protein